MGGVLAMAWAMFGTLTRDEAGGSVVATAKKVAARPPRRTRGEVDKEFGQLQEQVREAREDSSPKQDDALRRRDEEVRQAVDGISVDQVIQRVSGLGLDLSKALAGLKEQLSEEVARLIAVREAIELEQRELGRLHQIDIAATALDQLVEDYERKKKALELEMTTQRSAWEEESRTVERERQEQQDALKKQRQREIDDYEYKKALERKKAQDKYEEEQRGLERKNQEKQEALEKQWQQREASLHEREDELARLRQESSEFPDRLQKEVERATAEAIRQTEGRVQQQILVLQKDAEADRRVAELRIKTLEEMSAQQAAQVASLQKQLDEAKVQVQEIAVRAIEGASGAKALSHINQIAMEQAKHRPQQG